MTPYRLHAMRRLAAEIPAIRIVHVFSHSLQRNSMPWSIEIPDDLDVRFFAYTAMPPRSRLHLNGWRLRREVVNVIDEVHPDVLVLHGHSDLSRWLIALATRARGIPILHASDANGLEESAAPSVRSLVRFMYLKLVLANVDGYLPMGLAGRVFYRRFGDRRKPLFYFPYEPDSVVRQVAVSNSLAFAQRSGLRPGRRHFLYSGRLVRVKQVDNVIRAFSLLADIRPNWDLVVAGTGPLGSELRQLVPKSLADRVHFVGFLQVDDLAAAYHFCDVLVHSSRREAWGLVIHEAVSAGMAVVASDTAGAGVELVRHRVNGLLYPSGSLDSLKSAMYEVSDERTLGSMKARAGDVLKDWQQGFDPVRGFRMAVEHFPSRVH
jgi:glycosyltransferase involved in cell wall biosynthesis